MHSAVGKYVLNKIKKCNILAPWLHGMLHEGRWQSSQKYRTDMTAKQGRLKIQMLNIVGGSQCAECFVIPKLNAREVTGLKICGLVSYIFGRVATPLRWSRVLMQKHFQSQACDWDSRKPAASTKTKLGFSLARMVSALNIHFPHWRWQVHHTVRKKPPKRPSTHVPSLCCTTLVRTKLAIAKTSPKLSLTVA